jgi:glycerol-3-phosphate dehydrogenase
MSGCHPGRSAGSHSLLRYYSVRRDLRRLADEAYDLLIIGAGVYGAAMAWDATQRGLKVALVDRGDIGAGTSFNNAKTVHGGIRSLQHGQYREMREYLRERRALARIAPHLVHPLPFLLPTYGKLSRHKLPLRAYFAMYDLLTSDRNEGVDPARHLRASELISREECLRRHPALDPTGVTGGIVWHDCQMYSGDRVTLAYARSAARAGAAVANYVEAVTLLTGKGDNAGARGANGAGSAGVWTGDRVIGATLCDTLTGETFDVRATLTVNATGPYSSELLSPLTAVRAVPAVVPALSVAMNVVVRPLARDCAVGGAAQGRLFFLAPWRDVTIGGTSHEPYRGTASALRVTAAEVARLLDDLNVAFPGARLGLDDVRLLHRGLLPSHADRTGTRVALLKHSRVRDHREDGWSGLMSVVGVRYTTARHTAEQATDLALRMLNRPAIPSRTASTPLVGGDIDDYAAFMREAGCDEAGRASRTAAPAGSASSGNASLGRATCERLSRLYGTERVRVEAIAAKAPVLAQPISAHCPVLGAEIVFAVREEMAVHLTDALLRRTDAGSAGHPGADALENAARVMGGILEWNDERRREEIAAVERVYTIEG